jgi:hypothetical protein
LIAIAVWVLTAAVAAGSVLAAWHMRDGASRPPRLAGIAHGVAGAVGLGVLILALQGPPRGVATGVAAFGPAAAALFGMALLTGLVVLALRGKALPIAIHAGFAITGYVLLLAWSSLG